MLAIYTSRKERLMHSYKKDFIQLALKHQSLKFGEFTLKSGRVSPYFFNAGLFNSGEALSKVGLYIAQAIKASSMSFQMLFGPAYKGIPLVTTTAIALARDFQEDLPYCFNRKEKKDHGEKSLLVGSPLVGNVLIIDDVITAGTAIRESLDIIADAGAKAAGIVTLLNREEKGLQDCSAIEEIQKTYNIPVMSLIRLQDLLVYLESDQTFREFLPAMKAYKEKYGV